MDLESNVIDAAGESGVKHLVLSSALGAADYALAVLMPASVILTTMLYCSFYATYRGCFGVQTQKISSCLMLTIFIRGGALFDN